MSESAEVAVIVDDVHAFVTDLESALVLLGRPSPAELAAVLAALGDLRAELRSLYGVVERTLASEACAGGFVSLIVPGLGRVDVLDNGHVAIPPHAVEWRAQ